MTSPLFSPALPREVAAMRYRIGLCASLLLSAFAATAFGQEKPSEAASQRLFERMVFDVVEPREKAFFDGFASWEDWQRASVQERAALRHDLGLDGLELGGPLEKVVTGTEEFEDVIVEKVHFQSSPGLYVTANLYLPKERQGKVPAILYLCGHGRVAKDGVSYGNKAHYQHHGVGFAKHGFACLVVDTIQLGEIEGLHHGTHHLERWDWVDRGYTPAGIEAWNAMRAIDLLCADERIDADRIGVTGRSGGGAYSWWTAALDERVKCAAPVAGITDLRNHVVDNCVSGHCDCMYFVNHRGVDYSRVVALVAPRPLLLVNTDRDGIFPLDGVVRTIEPVFGLYELAGKREDVGVAFGPGNHEDTPDIQLPVLRWMLAHLQPNYAGPVEVDAFAKKPFEPERLKVFATLPEDEKVTTVQDWRLPAVPMPATMTADAWEQRRTGIVEFLDRTAFPRTKIQVAETKQGEERDGVIRETAVDAVDSGPYGWRTETDRPADGKASDALLVVEPTWKDPAAADAYPTSWGVPANDEQSAKLAVGGMRVVRFYPREAGPAEGKVDPKIATQWRRKFYLLGQSLPMQQALDLDVAVGPVAGVPKGGPEPGDVKRFVYSRGDAVLPTLAWLVADAAPDFEARLDLRGWRHDATGWIDIARVMDPRELILVAAERHDVLLVADDDDRKALETLADSIGRDRFRLEFEDEDAAGNLENPSEQ